MERRDFLKDMTLAALLAGLGPKGWDQAAKAAGAPDLALVEGDSPAKITKEAIAVLGGMDKFVAKGDVVMIKPNIGWDRTPELAACTNPEVVKALVELSFGAGAKKVIVMDNTTNQAQRCYARSGIQAAAKEAGADVPFINERRVKKMAIKGEWLKEWDVLQDFIEVDKLINVPIVKHHSLCRATLGMKNWLGAVGGSRNQLHQSIDQAVVDLAAFFKPALTVLDAYRILIRNGPQGGRPSDTKLLKTIVAGKDWVACDAMGATFLDIPPAEMPFIKIAGQKGFGVFNLEKLRLEKRTV
ncbi:MAG: DUF362 domain-containing protein [Candidatus Aminicenantales bacterium]